MAVNGKTMIKANFQGDRRLLELSSISYAGLLSSLSTVYKLPASGIVLTYLDSDGDCITFDNDDELQLAVRTCDGPLKVTVAVLEASANPSPAPNADMDCDLPADPSAGDKSSSDDDDNNADPVGFGGKYRADSLLLRVAAKRLERRLQVCCSPEQLYRLMAVLELPGQRLTKRGLAPSRLLDPTITELDPLDMGVDESTGVPPGMEHSSLPHQPPQGLDPTQHPIHQVLTSNGINFSPSEAHLILRALGVRPCRFVKLGLVPADAMPPGPGRFGHEGSWHRGHGRGHGPRGRSCGARGPPGMQGHPMLHGPPAHNPHGPEADNHDPNHSAVHGPPPGARHGFPPGPPPPPHHAPEGHGFSHGPPPPSHHGPEGRGINLANAPTGASSPHHLGRHAPHPPAHPPQHGGPHGCHPRCSPPPHCRGPHRGPGAQGSCRQAEHPVGGPHPCGPLPPHHNRPDGPSGDNMETECGAADHDERHPQGPPPHRPWGPHSQPHHAWGAGGRGGCGFGRGSGGMGFGGMGRGGRKSGGGFGWGGGDFWGGMPCRGARFCAKKEQARFVKHDTMEDKSTVPAGAAFEKAWIVRNDSQEPWPESCQLVPLDQGCKDFGSAAPVAVAGGVRPGEQARVAVDLTASRLPGQYEAYWRLGEADGERFGQRLWTNVMVTEVTEGASKGPSAV